MVGNKFFINKVPIITLLILSFFKAEAQETVTTIYGDGHPSGSPATFYQSSVGSVVTYNDSNNLVGFVSDGVTYSTGVDDTYLITNGVTGFTPAVFSAFPMPSTISNPTLALVGIGYNWDGVNQTNAAGDYINTFSPIIPSSFVRDGENGLELASNYFNIPGQTITYDAIVINETVSINDAMPDILVTQTGAPGATDKFKFIDSDGATVGSELDVTFSGVNVVGRTTWTIYRVNSSGGLSGTFGINTDRDLRLISFKLSDFGITISNYNQISNFVHQTSGNTDIAFTAFNEGALEIFLPDVELEVSDSSIAPDDYCNPTEATFETKITNNSTEEAKDFTVEFNLPVGVDYDTNSSVFSPIGSGIAFYNTSTEKWNISGLEAGQSVTLTVTDDNISGADFPLSFTPTVALDFQTDTDTSNDSEFFEALGNDNDCDGVEDTTDLDDDNDGILDTDEGVGDLDGDGIPNHLDLDSDGDQCPDALEGDGTVVLANLDENFAITGSVNATTGVPTLVGSDQGIGFSQDDSTKSCDTTDTDLDGYIDIVDSDDDNDGILDENEDTGVVDDVDGIDNHLDSDSDGDGCPDALEGNGGFTYASLDINNRLTGGVDENGVPLVATASGQTIGTSQDNTMESSTCSIPSVMITQVYQTGSGNAIEVTNVGPVTVSSINLSLFKDTASPSGVIPVSVTIPTLNSGQSAIIKSASFSVTLTNSPVEIINASVTDIEDGDDIIVLSSTTDSTSWVNRYDEVKNIDNETSLVRIDEVLTYNQDYTSSEWMSFVSDAIEVRGDETASPAVITRHANAPVLSDVESGIAMLNSSLGYHVLNPTIRVSGSWSNGNPDKSRSVIIQENYDHSGSRLNARTLDVQSNILSIDNGALIVVNGVNIASGAEIRILGESQLIQTHDGLSQVTGDGKLLINQMSDLTTIYRYNYWSSPVVESEGSSTARVGQVMKDASGALTATSTIDDINFITDQDGSVGTPINISNHWIWSYFNEETSDDWIQIRETSYLNRGLGYTMKSTGFASQYFTFSGTPNDGSFSFVLDGDTTSLLGNPYPGTLDGKAFLLDNADALNGTLYFWEHTGESSESGHLESGYQGGYATLTLSMGTVATVATAGIDGLGTPTKVPSRYIATGQGFFASSDVDGGTISFNNKQRSYNADEPDYVASDDAVFFKTKALKTIENGLPILKLGFNFNNEDKLSLHRQIGISFNENHSYNFDYGYDAEMIDVNSTDIYWDFEQMNDKKLVIAGVEQIAEDLRVPLTITVDTEESVSLNIDTLENIDEEVYLYDTLEGTYQTIEENELLSLSLPKGVYEDRFFVTFNNNSTLSSVVDGVSIINLQVYLDNQNDKIIITKNVDLEIDEIQLFNVFGQKMDIKFNEDETDVEELPMGVYFIKVKTNQGIVSKKIFKQ